MLTTLIVIDTFQIRGGDSFTPAEELRSEVLGCLSQALARLNKCNDAHRCAEEAVNMDPSCENLLWLGVSRFKLKNIDGALEACYKGFEKSRGKRERETLRSWVERVQEEDAESADGPEGASEALRL